MTKVYQTPAIVYEGKISTRAGSAPSTPRDGDPAGIFG